MQKATNALSAFMATIIRFEGMVLIVSVVVTECSIANALSLNLQ